MVSDALFKQKKSLPMPNQNNVEFFFTFFKRNLSWLIFKISHGGCELSASYLVSRLLDFAQPRDNVARETIVDRCDQTYKPA